MNWREVIENEVRRTNRTIYLMDLFAVTVLVLGCTGCLSALVGENKQRELIEIRFYDQETGKPLKVCKIIDSREIEVMFLDDNGKPIIKKLKLTGGMYTPPPLPAVKESLTTEAEKPK